MSNILIQMNEHIEYALLVGVTPIAKAGWYSGLNNITVGHVILAWSNSHSDTCTTQSWLFLLACWCSRKLKSLSWSDWKKWACHSQWISQFTLLCSLNWIQRPLKSITIPILLVVVSASTPSINYVCLCRRWDHGLLDLDRFAIDDHFCS